ncbi:MAG: hypothetical protein CL583_00290 [Alteromonadaceae bacterium]|nr:hypothetical protein [Alteromonadaceae bacterium]
MNDIDAIIAELRVPGLPYALGSTAEEASWAANLSRSWSEQTDATVVDTLKNVEANWSVRQVNAAYLADRVMDVFLRTSGLHVSLVRRIARLRFYLACQLHSDGESAVSRLSPLRQWLDHLVVLRGWSDDQGRSSKRLLNRLDAMTPVIHQAINEGPASADAHFLAWLAAEDEQEQKAGRLRNRLLDTETGAARQRAAEMCSACRVSKVLSGRRLPREVIQLVEGPWQALLRQTALVQGIESDLWKQATRSLDWAIWALDPEMSAQDRNRLYQVAAELPERLASLWQAIFSEALPAELANGLQHCLIARMQGESSELVAIGQRSFDPVWLDRPRLPDAVRCNLGRWMVRGEGEAEQRRWLFAYLETTGEVLWLNSEGVKQGLDQADTVADELKAGTQRVLPEPLPFEAVLETTTTALMRVLDAQQKQRQAAALRARQEAATLREKRREAQLQAEAEALQQEADTRRAQLAEQENERLMNEAEQAASAREREEHLAGLVTQVDGLHLGAWIEVTGEDVPKRLKLAVKMKATGKLVFVDRLGLNQRVMYRPELAEMIMTGGARILDKGAEFDDTLSRVVGRIRVGR